MPIRKFARQAGRKLGRRNKSREIRGKAARRWRQMNKAKNSPAARRNGRVSEVRLLCWASKVAAVSALEFRPRLMEARHKEMSSAPSQSMRPLTGVGACEVGLRSARAIKMKDNRQKGRLSQKIKRQSKKRVRIPPYR
ncbi:MAG: hypothetical protein MUC85_12860 [Anaerolineales bacterium]|nr:hypothetical protein [Anaerolineales bacterium]